MSAEGRAKLWAREKIERLTPKSRPERKPFHGVKLAREALCSPKSDRAVTDEIPPYDVALYHTSERELFFDADAERAARRHKDSTDEEESETRAAADGDDSV